MNTQIFYDDQVELQPVLDRRIAIVGYGAQGRAHALNLRDSGCQVRIGQRPGPGWEQAIQDGFTPESIAVAAEWADVINLMLPDEVHGDVFAADIRDRLVAGDVLMACHGFSFHYGLVDPPPGVDRLLVAPKGQGHMVRGAYQAGGGVPCLVAVAEGASASTFPLGLAYAKAIGGTRAGVLETTIGAETETDLFGEQAVLCGGLSALVQAGFETLVEHGYQPELAYFECLHELKIIVDLLHRGGLTEMRKAISTTAEYGDCTRGARIIGDQTRAEMKTILREIQSGEFAREFLEQYRLGHPELTAIRKQTPKLPIETVGQDLRVMMPRLNPQPEEDQA